MNYNLKEQLGDVQSYLQNVSKRDLAIGTAAAATIGVALSCCCIDLNPAEIYNNVTTTTIPSDMMGIMDHYTNQLNSNLTNFSNR